MFAIVRTGGKQYRVAVGSTVDVERLDGEPDSTVELTDVLLVHDDSGVHVGSPSIPGARLVATILEQTKARKINGFTFKPKKNVGRRYGHRQLCTRLRVDSIEIGAPGRKGD